MTTLRSEWFESGSSARTTGPARAADAVSGGAMVAKDGLHVMAPLFERPVLETLNARRMPSRHTR